MNKLLISLKRGFGRNGKLLCRSKGRTKKVLYRLVDFYLSFLEISIFVYVKYITDPFRNCKLVLCLTLSGFICYILGPAKQKFPRYFNLFNLANLNRFMIGQPVTIDRLKEGDFIFNVSFYKNFYGQFSRSAGKTAQIVKLNFLNNYALVKLKNNRKLVVHKTNVCLLGVVNNELAYNLRRGKAGYFMIRGFKSHVRGIARNPVDHPNGGRTPGGKVYRSLSCRIARSLKKTKSFRNLYVESV